MIKTEMRLPEFPPEMEKDLHDMAREGVYTVFTAACQSAPTDEDLSLRMTVLLYRAAHTMALMKNNWILQNRGTPEQADKYISDLIAVYYKEETENPEVKAMLRGGEIIEGGIN